MAVAIGVVVVLLVFLLIVMGSAVRILREYERGVIFRLGRLIAQKGPGLILLIPIIDRMVRVDLRTVTLNIPPQEVITRDNVPASVNAVCYFRVIDPNKAIVEVENFLLATSQIAQTTLRSVLGKAELDQLLAERERLNEDLQTIIDEQTEPWGVKVTTVEIKDVEIPDQMQRAMARQAEAERERRAKIINSEGEYQAAQKLADAADIISQNPATLQLRYLQTLLEMGVNQNTTIVFPLPMDMLKPVHRYGQARRCRRRARQAASARLHLRLPPNPRRATCRPRGPSAPWVGTGSRSGRRAASRRSKPPRPCACASSAGSRESLRRRKSTVSIRRRPTSSRCATARSSPPAGCASPAAAASWSGWSSSEPCARPGSEPSCSKRASGRQFARDRRRWSSTPRRRSRASTRHAAMSPRARPSSRRGSST